MEETSPQIEGATEPEPRRSFLNRLWMGLGLLGAVELFAVLFGYLKPRTKSSPSNASDGVLNLGSIDQYKNGSVTAFVRGRFYICRLEDGGILAVSRQCTHLGCTVLWDEARSAFVCPCHASAFSQQGDVISAPAPRPLDTYEVAIANGIVRVDTGKRHSHTTSRTRKIVYSDADLDRKDETR